MATSNSTMTEVMELEQTELVIPQQYLCCRICDEEFKQPRFLPCLHTFCDSCITGHINKSIDDDNYFPCPICATEIKNEQDVAPLQENILARRLSKVSSSTNLKPQTLCWYCKNAGNFIDAVAVCEECDNSALCATCTESHKTTAETQDHNLISIDEYEARVEKKQEDGLSQNDHVIQQCCDLYDAMDIGAMFCVDCDLLICADCHVNNHGDHRCAELTAVAGHFESKIKDPLDELSNDEKELNDALHQLDESKQMIESQTIKLHEVVRKRTKFLTDLIQEYEKMLIQEVNKRNTLKMDEISNRKYDIKMHLQSINGVKEFTENLLSYGSYEEKVFLRKKVGYRIRELCEESLATDEVETLTLRLTKPNVTVETICNMFGELTEREINSNTDGNQTNSNADIYPLNIENGHGSDTAENNDPELIEIFNHAHDSQYNSGSDTEMFSASNSNNSEGFKNVKFNEDIEKAEFEAEHFFELGEPKRETELPTAIQRECIKGIGINSKGDMIVGTTSSGSQMIYVLEKRGIVKGTVPVNNGWNIHSVASDGKVAMTIPRGDNRFKVRVLENDGTGHILSDSNIESFGLNFVTADKNGNIIVTSNRYAKLRSHHGKSAKSGGNIAFYSKDGLLTKRVTNEDFHEFNLYLLEKPQCVAVDNSHDLLVVTDPGSNTVIAFNLKGELIFEYGNTDTDGEIYQGPDLVSIDKFGNIVVTDKREGRIDILSSKGQLKKSLLLDDIPRFVGTLPDKLLVIIMPEGTMKYYEYL